MARFSESASYHTSISAPTRPQNENLKYLLQENVRFVIETIRCLSHKLPRTAPLPQQDIRI